VFRVVRKGSFIIWMNGAAQRRPVGCQGIHGVSFQDVEAHFHRWTAPIEWSSLNVIA
jgi:hypothetical protein